MSLQPNPRVMQIYVNKDGQQTGPYTVDQVQQYLQQGHLTLKDYAYYEGCQEWVTIAQVPGITAGNQAAAVTSQSTKSPTKPSGQQQAVAVASPKRNLVFWSTIGVSALVATVLSIFLFKLSGEVDDLETAAEKADKDAQALQEGADALESNLTTLAEDLVEKEVALEGATAALKEEKEQVAAKEQEIEELKVRVSEYRNLKLRSNLMTKVKRLIFRSAPSVKFIP